MKLQSISRTCRVSRFKNLVLLASGLWILGCSNYLAVEKDANQSDSTSSSVGEATQDAESVTTSDLGPETGEVIPCKDGENLCVSVPDDFRLCSLLWGLDYNVSRILKDRAILRLRPATSPWNRLRLSGDILLGNRVVPFESAQYAQALLARGQDKLADKAGWTWGKLDVKDSTGVIQDLRYRVRRDPNLKTTFSFQEASASQLELTAIIHHPDYFNVPVLLRFASCDLGDAPMTEFRFTTEKGEQIVLKARDHFFSSDRPYQIGRVESVTGTILGTPIDVSKPEDLAYISPRHYMDQLSDPAFFVRLPKASKFKGLLIEPLYTEEERYRIYLLDAQHQRIDSIKVDAKSDGDSRGRTPQSPSLGPASRRDALRNPGSPRSFGPHERRQLR